MSLSISRDFTFHFAVQSEIPSKKFKKSCIFSASVNVCVCVCLNWSFFFFFFYNFFIVPFRFASCFWCAWVPLCVPCISTVCNKRWRAWSFCRRLTFCLFFTAILSIYNSHLIHFHFNESILCANTRLQCTCMCFMYTFASIYWIWTAFCCHIIIKWIRIVPFICMYDNLTN